MLFFLPPQCYFFHLLKFLLNFLLNAIPLTSSSSSSTLFLSPPQHYSSHLLKFLLNTIPLTSSMLFLSPPEVSRQCYFSHLLKFFLKGIPPTSSMLFVSPPQVPHQCWAAAPAWRQCVAEHVSSSAPGLLCEFLHHPLPHCFLQFCAASENIHAHTHTWSLCFTASVTINYSVQKQSACVSAS